ncbi:hypothetical protein DMC47_05905 [Nostoc sp. 3335mG]|nr:hypothetical protein DMC47_05905 [Nostoc sp. 3335mG]
MRRFLLGFVLALCAGLAGPAWPADGKAVGVDPDAVARLSGTDRILEVGADISLGEQVVTGPSGQVQVVFSDGTRLVVGPGSALLIESYLFNGNTADKFAINALAGSFRFISGNSPKSAYSIRTPTASIAIRGTKFDFNVTRRRTDVLLYEGAVQLCAAGGDCAELVARCHLGSVDAGSASLLLPADPDHLPLSQQFRYARFQVPLLSDFRIAGATRCTEPPATGGVPDTLGTTVGGDNPTRSPAGAPTPTPTPTPRPVVRN